LAGLDRTFAGVCPVVLEEERARRETSIPIVDTFILELSPEAS
jgi:hypothetical protein